MPIGERLGRDHHLQPGEVIGAIDVGSNAVRLKLARLSADGSFEIVHQERDPIAPGEGVWRSGAMAPAVVSRLVTVLARYARQCHTHGAGHVRAVATSALREAKNKAAIISLVREKAGVELEVIPGREEARLIALGVFRGMPAGARPLLIDIGGGSTEVARGEGELPTELWSVPIGAVRLTDAFGGGSLDRHRLVAMRHFAQRAILEALPVSGRSPKHALGSSGTIRALCSFAAREGRAAATAIEMTQAVEELVALGETGRRKRFDPQRAAVIVAGAVVLEAVMHHLRVDTVTAVEGGLKEGVLVDLQLRAVSRSHDPILSDALVNAGRRFQFDEAHAVHTRDVALLLFDRLESHHGLPPEARLLLEAAAMLHDVGSFIGRSGHHKHSRYLIEHLDLPGLSDGERDLVALVARFHRRSLPLTNHPNIKPLAPLERRVVQVLALLLRLADGTDLAREQAIQDVDVTSRGKKLRVVFRAKRGKPVDQWDPQDEQSLARLLFDQQLYVAVDHIGARKR
jgi:exopolyphosphatase / guanosine-5'-triphosphate,3'-diphosphate pyrophosphatase